MLTISAMENIKEYIFTVTDGTEENTYEYKFGKNPPEGVALNDYLQTCKKESLALAELVITQKQPPTPITI